MTTTPERKTPEQIARKALVVTQREGLPRPRQAAQVITDLRAAGLLVGDPTEEQIERALEALSRFNEWTDNPRGAMRAALTAATGVAPQEPIERWRRLRSCVENWPDAATGEYTPACCRFPKSCSATVYDPERVSEDDLEPAPSPDREKLIANYCPEHGDLLNRPADGADARSQRCRDAHDLEEIHAALAAAPVVDEAKLGEVIDRASVEWGRSGRHEPISAAITRAVLEHLAGER